MKVFAIPPPIIIISTLGNRLEITEILSVTLAPPIMEAIGVFGCTTAATLVHQFLFFGVRNLHP